MISDRTSGGPETTWELVRNSPDFATQKADPGILRPFQFTSTMAVARLPDWITSEEFQR